jgi:two-component system OmpR family response regulator
MGLNLLIVEDDAALAAMMARELREFDHDVTVTGDGVAALSAVEQDRFDAVVLDRMLPELDGISVLERLRGDDVGLPVIMLSALGLSNDKVEGLDAGADDYVVKPVAAVELNARINAVVRGRQWPAVDASMLRAGDIVISPKRFRAWRAGKPIPLAKLEFDLLLEFVRNADNVVPRASLFEKVWGLDFEPQSNILDVYVGRLRRKLMEQGGDDPFTTVRRVGYMLRG